MDIAKIIAKVEKMTGLKAYYGDSESLVVEKIPFNIPQLDMAIGGGIPCGRITELVGEFSAGKTYLCQQLIRTAQYMNRSSVFFNAENKYDPSWFALTGIDVSNLVVVQGNIAESVFDAVKSYVEEGVGLVILDSIASLVPISEDTDEMIQQTIGLQARVLSKGFRKLLPALSTSKTALVFTNQLRSSIGTYGGDTFPGGRSQYFYASMILRIRRGEWIPSSQDRQGFYIVVRSIKNTLAPPWREVMIPFSFMTGQVDIISSLCQMAVDEGIVTKTGAWYSFGEDKLQGWEGLLEFFRQDVEKIKELTEAIAGGE